LYVIVGIYIILHSLQKYFPNISHTKKTQTIWRKIRTSKTEYPSPHCSPKDQQE
jgi:hypothetical protein